MSGEMKDYGAIRRLYTPKNGTRVTEVSQIQDGSTLVVSKTNRFRKIPYSSILNIRDREARFKTSQANRPAIKLRSPVKVLPRRCAFCRSCCRFLAPIAHNHTNLLLLNISGSSRPRPYLARTTRQHVAHACCCVLLPVSHYLSLP